MKQNRENNRCTGATGENNYAFIDSQNLNLGIHHLGWGLDFKKFRTYLRDAYNVTSAYLFIGYIEENAELYETLKRAGYQLVFKPVVIGKDHAVKGNIDADLVLHAMAQYNRYDRAVIVSSDGDFYSLVNYLYQNKKLKAVMSPYIKTCSSLLKKSAKEKITFMSTLRKRLKYNKEVVKTN